MAATAYPCTAQYGTASQEPAPDWIAQWPAGIGASTDLSKHSPPAEPVAVWVTWQRDPTTTLSVHWLEQGDALDALHWRPRGEKAWRRASSVRHTFAGDEFRTATYTPHHAELEHLDPGTDYELSFAIDGQRSAVRVVRTLPDFGTPESVDLTIAHTGCILHLYDKYTAGLNQIAAQQPDFAVLCGDIAYANGEPDLWHKWVNFLKLWDRLARAHDTPDGAGPHKPSPARLIPVVAAIGNHEVLGSYDRPHTAATFFYDLFSFPASGYGVLDIGEHVSLVVLDSDHTNETDGPQQDWLTAVLEERQDRLHLIAAYHVPAYPGHRRFGTKRSGYVRRDFVPLFDRFGVDLCLEAHDHCYKRTQPMRHGRVDANGIIYLGDGGLAVTTPRNANRPGDFGFVVNLFKDADAGTAYRPYLAAAESSNAFTLVELNGPHRRYTAIRIDGSVIETYAHTDGEPAPILNTPHARWYENWDTFTPIILAALLGGVGLGVSRARRARLAKPTA